MTSIPAVITIKVIILTIIHGYWDEIMTYSIWREYFDVNEYNMNLGAAEIPILVPPPASCMIWGNLFNLLMFFHLKENSSSYLVGL